MFPEHWPQPCPPDDAMPAAGAYYHLVGADPPTPHGRHADCRSQCEKKGGDACLRCQACGLSVFPTAEDAHLQFLANAAWMGDHLARRIWKFVAKAALTPDHGRTKLTGGTIPTHTTWWPAAVLDVPARCALFTVEGGRLG